MRLPLQKERIPVKLILLYGFLPSFLKRIIYRIKGFKIGSNVHFGLGSILIGKDVIIKNNVDIGFLSVIQAKKIEIGEYSSIASLCYIDTEFLKIGMDTRIREQVSVAGYKTPESKLIIGDRCLIGQSVLINPTMPVIMGNDSGIGGRSLIFTHSSRLSQLEGFPVKFGPIKIGNKVWISWNSFITSGIEIGNNAVIQPNTVVTKNIPSNSTFTSPPSRIISNFFYKPVSPVKKIQIIKHVVDDFIGYLEYEGINAIKKNGTITCLIDNFTYKILIQEESKVELSSAFYNIVLFIQNSDNIIDRIRDKDMVLSFKDNTRRGSNLLGEELIKFFSRHGIRFIRI